MSVSGNAIAAEKHLQAGADPTGKDSYGESAGKEACDKVAKGHADVCVVRES